MYEYRISVMPLARTLYRKLCRIQSVEAVFVVENDGIVTSYTVVPDFTREVISEITDAEEEVARFYNSIDFDFRVRASQGRDPRAAVPINVDPIFLR